MPVNFTPKKSGVSFIPKGETQRDKIKRYVRDAGEVLQKVGQGVDLLTGAGPLRTIVGGALTGHLVDDVSRIPVLDMPGGEEYAGRLGVNDTEFPVRYRGIPLGKTSLKKLVGSAIDVGSGLGAGSLLKKAGKWFHGQAYNVPEAVYRDVEGKKGLGPKEVAWQEGIDSTKDILPAIEKEGGIRAGDYSAVTETGARIDINRATAKAESRARAMIADPDTKVQAHGRMALEEIERIKRDYGPKYSEAGAPEIPGLPATTRVEKKTGMFKPVAAARETEIDFIDQTKEVPNPKYDPFSLTPMEPKTTSVTTKTPIQYEVSTPIEGKVPYTYNEWTQVPAVPAIPAVPAKPFTPAVTVERASRLKTGLNDEVANDQWNIFKRSQEGREFSEDLAEGVKDEIRRTAEEAIPGKGASIAKSDEKMSAMYSLGEQATPEIMKEARRNKLLSPVDAPLGLIGGAGPLAVKKTADLAKIPLFKTKGGRLIHHVGSRGQELAPLQGLWNMGADEQRTKNILDMYYGEVNK